MSGRHDYGRHDELLLLLLLVEARMNFPISPQPGVDVRVVVVVRSTIARTVSMTLLYHFNSPNEVHIIHPLIPIRSHC